MQNTVDIILLMLIFGIYLLPTVIAFGRDHPRRGLIAFLNILFGWTLIVWFIVFEWAALTPVEAAEVS